MWSLLFLLFSGVEATSNGVGITCDVDQPNLGSTQREVKSNLTMWWTLPAQFAGNQYTLRTADPISAAQPRTISTSKAPTAAPTNPTTKAPTTAAPTTKAPTTAMPTNAPTTSVPTKAPTQDPSTYLPNEWINIYVRTNNQDKQFNGLILYAVNAANQKVGDWQVPVNAPYHVMETQPCVVHSNADPKNYLSVFKFKGPPVGTGTVTIKALVKFGLAFPSNTGMFFWPNSAHLKLTEGAPLSQGWFEGEVGESCITVCTKRGLGCNLAAMQSQGNSPNLVDKVSAFTNCTGPMLPGCSAASPSVGQAGCFYHSDTCIQPAPADPWVRNDICANLAVWGTGCCQNTQGCCSYMGAAWCCAYNAGSEAPNANNPYGPWGAKQKGGGMIGNCTPPGSLPASQMTVALPARVNPGAKAITCEATKKSVEDGRRICACSSDGKYVADVTDSAASLSVLTVVLLAPLFVSF